MVWRRNSKQKAEEGEDKRVYVVDSRGRRPFMRGIMVHSLTARGIDFDHAYQTADRVREAIRGRLEVPREELANLVGEMMGAEPTGPEVLPAPLPASIEVGGGERTVPFSKGELSQSLLAASVDPTDAFDVAREIELSLHRAGRLRVTRTELREVAYSALLERFDEATADRFLTWRRYQEPTKPVIVLLGGTTGVGKTSIALEVGCNLLF